MHLFVPSALTIFLIMIISIPPYTAEGQQDQSVMIPISDTYIGAAGQVELGLLPGWQGFEIQLGDGSTIMMASPNGTDPVSQDAYLTPTISVITDDKDDDNNNNGNNLQEPQSKLYELLPFLEGSVFRCQEEPATGVRINEATGLQSVIQCQSADDENGLAIKMNLVTLETEEFYVAVVYAAPDHIYEEYEHEFTESLKSLKVFGAIDFIPGGLELVSNSFAIDANGTAVNIEVKSSSSIKNVEFAESERYFKLHLQGEGSGVTILPISRILEGPYVVTIDGQEIQDLQVVEEQPSGDSIIKLNYSSGSHDVVISGTRVVPEFSPSVVMGMSAILTIVSLAVAARLRVASSARA